MTVKNSEVIALLSETQAMIAALKAEIHRLQKEKIMMNEAENKVVPVPSPTIRDEALYRNQQSQPAPTPVQEAPKKIWTREEIDHILNNNNLAVQKAIINLWKLQTESEKNSGSTKVTNNYGFSAFHARKGTYLANWINRGNNLTGKHIDKAREIALRHSKQLVDIANGIVKV